MKDIAIMVVGFFIAFGLGMLSTYGAIAIATNYFQLN